MPDSVTTSSLLKVSTHAPGGITMETVQDSSEYSLETLVALFGTRNVREVSQRVTQNINNVISTAEVPQLQVRNEPSSSILVVNGVTKTIPSLIPRITALSERTYARGELLAMYTASRTEEEAATITGSIEVVVDNDRAVSADPVVQSLYNASSSVDPKNPLKRTFEKKKFDTHKATMEYVIEDFYTASEDPINLSDFGYDFADDAVADLDNSSEKYTEYYPSGSIIYTDVYYDSVFGGDENKYFTLSGSNESWLITSEGKIARKYQTGDRQKVPIKLIFDVSKIDSNSDDVCTNTNYDLRTVWWYDRTFYTSQKLTEEFVASNVGHYVKNITWNEATIIDTSGVFQSSVSCVD